MNPIKDILTGGIGQAIDSVTDGAANIISKLKADPTEVVKSQTELEKLKNDAKKSGEDYAVRMEEQFTKQQEIVNTQMAVESKSEHTMVWAWRPTIGFTFCLMIINNYVALPYLKKYGLEPVELPDQVFMAILVILGAASAGRGLTQWQRAKK